MESQTAAHRVDSLQLRGRYLTFALGSEEYGVGILSIQEVIGFFQPTPVPKSPEHLLGFINLRGTIVPVIELRKAFGLPTAQYGERSCIIVLQSHLNAVGTSVGVVVDAVLDVVSLDERHLQNVPNYGTSLDTSFLLGLGRLEEQTIILVDMRKVLERCHDAIVCVQPGQIKNK